MARNSNTHQSKLLGLEALRFVAAFAVLIWHYQHFSYVADRPVDLVLDQLPFYGLLQPFYALGEYGVWIFWCISGCIFFWNYRDTIADRSMPGWTFTVFRLSRLYPLHLVTLLGVAILQAVYFHLKGYFFVYQTNDLQHFIPQIFLASEWAFQSGTSFNGPIWSVSAEVLVYVVFFLMLRYVTKSPLLNLTLIALCLNFKGQIFSCLAVFYAGGLAAIARQSLASVPVRATIERLAWLAAVVVPAVISFFGLQRTIVDWVFVLTYTPLLLFCLSSEVTLPQTVRNTLTMAGSMTYSTYLLHFPIQLIIALWFAMSGHRIPFDQTWFFLAFVISTLLAAYPTYRYFEAPAQSLLRTTLLAARGTAAETRVSIRGSMT